MPEPITVQHGIHTFEVVPCVPDDPEIEAPFALVVTNPRSPYFKQRFRLWRNQHRPEICFLVRESGQIGRRSVYDDLWFKVADGKVTPLRR